MSAGPITIAAVLRLGDTTDGSLIYAEASGGGERFYMGVFGGSYHYAPGGMGPQNTVSASTSDSWHLVATTKASGTAAPRGHKHVYDTNAWTHTDAGGSVGDGSTLGAGAVFRLATWAQSEFLNAHIAWVGIWTRAMTDAEVENLASSLQAVLASAPAALWLLDQSATTQAVVDLVGTAHQSSATDVAVSGESVPTFSYGHPILIPHSVTTASGTNAAAEAAAAAVAAEAPTVTVATQADASTATATAQDAQAAVATSAQAATATAAAADAATAVSVSAECATATAAALDATVTTGANTSASAECATATAVANDPAASIAATAPAATASAAAQDATVQTGSVVNAAAECATASGAANDPGAAVRAGIEAATASAAADAAAASVAAAAVLAEATAIVDQAALAIGAAAEPATAAGIAYNAVGDTGVVVTGAGARITAGTAPTRITTSTTGGRL